MLNTAGLLLFSALGVLVAFKCGFFNLGGEGQIYLGGFLTALFLQTTVYNPALQFTAVMISVFFITAVVGGISGILKIYFNTNELLSSFLLSSAVIPIIDYLIMVTFRNKNGNLLALPSIADEFKLVHFLKPSVLNASFFISVLFLMFFLLFFSRTKLGYRLYIFGKAPEFSVFSGFSFSVPAFLSMSISGGMHGLTGFFGITGVWHFCHLGFSSGMGWAALSVALMAKNNFVLLPFMSLLYAWIKTASDAVVMAGKLQFDTAVFFQAAVFFFISADFAVSKKNKLQRFSERIKNYRQKRKLPDVNDFSSPPIIEDIM